MAQVIIRAKDSGEVVAKGYLIQSNHNWAEIEIEGGEYNGFKLTFHDEDGYTFFIY